MVQDEDSPGAESKSSTANRSVQRRFDKVLLDFCSRQLMANSSPIVPIAQLYLLHDFCMMVQSVVDFVKSMTKTSSWLQNGVEVVIIQPVADCVSGMTKISFPVQNGGAEAKAR